MGKFYSALTPELRGFIARQRMFFIATAPLSGEGRINLSPKGLDTFRIISDGEVAYLDYTGSGNETAAHVLENGRITIMFCSFDAKPLILRLYGRGRAITAADGHWTGLIQQFDDVTMTGIRQIIYVQVDSLQTSCGFGVPQYAFKSDRELMFDWAEKKGDEGLREYRAKKNRLSIDGLPTGLRA